MLLLLLFISLFIITFFIIKSIFNYFFYNIFFYFFNKNEIESIRIDKIDDVLDLENYIKEMKEYNRKVDKENNKILDFEIEKEKFKDKDKFHEKKNSNKSF